jgi:deoxyribonuclease IV
MRRLGVHTSIAGGLHLSLERAHALGCSAIQIFSHNPRGWAFKTMSGDDISRFKSARKRLDISPVVIHTSYLINVASADPALRRKSIEMLAAEMDRADAVGADYVILHPGSASGDDADIARERAVNALQEVAAMGRWNARLLVENTAGERGDISSGIRELADILRGVRGNFLSGICFDTCHAFAAGYDLRSDQIIRKISVDIKKYIGPDSVKLIHLNDSKGDLGSRIDRHEHIGCGKIGEEGLRRFIHCAAFRNIPLILETPKKKETDDPVNLAKVREMIGQGQFKNCIQPFLK